LNNWNAPYWQWNAMPCIASTRGGRSETRQTLT
jgi:hypothetical protein